jgi:hypothetical protein
MITGQTPATRIHVYINGTGFEAFEEIVRIDIARGGQEFGPYRGGPEVGTVVVNCYYPPGTSIYVAGLIVGAQVEVSSVQLFPTVTVDNLFAGILQDFRINYVFDEASGQFGQTLTLFAFDQVGEIEKVSYPGMVTSRTTKNVSWETRINTLGAVLPGGSLAIPTTPEAHIFRLVDNNIDGSLADQFDVACNSVGATWLVDRNNDFRVYAKGAYEKTGCLFTDDPTYWNSGNKPVNAGSTIFYNLTYQNIEFGSDTANLVNTVQLTNVIPRNMQTRATTGALLYKDPATIPGPALPVLEQSWTSIDSSSVSTYGTRRRALTTNVYPYRTTDAEAYYVDWNTCIDPGCEYQNVRLTDTSNIRCDLTFSTTTPYAGTHSGAVTQTVVDTSVGFYIGPTEGYAFKVRPTVATNFYRMRVRATNANTLVTPQVEWLDSNGASLAIQNSAFTNLTNGVWTQIVCTFVPGTIPARAVAFRPRVVFGSISGATHPVGTIFRIDAISVNQGFDAAAEFSGDTPDTSTILYAWEGDPGDSFSYRTNNILDNIGAEVLSYWQGAKSNIQSLTWNARQNWSAVAKLEVGARIDVRFKGANYTAWISKMRYRIDTENILVTLDLSARPASWT